jgi:hypothetical protein
MNRTEPDSTFFDSFEDAKAPKARRVEEWEKQRQEYESSIRK